jgi:hypothetical protein
VSSQTELEVPKTKAQNNSKHLNRLKSIGILLTVGGIFLFAYFVYSVGVTEILEGISRIGFGGFTVILFIYFLRIWVRGMAWKLSVYEPYKLDLRDTIPAVIIGEAMSSIIPLGILISGTSKAVAVRNRVPLVVGLSSVATENLFYSLVTSLFIILGAFTFLRSFELSEGWQITIDILIVGILLLLIFGFLMVIRQWHLASEICEKLYRKGVLTGILEHGRSQVRLFENLIYGFYRRYPRRFLPIISMQVLFHLLGITEVLFILGKLSENLPTLLTAFLLETVTRLISIVFKLVPFLIGIDEAGSQFVTETLAIGAGIGVTIAIIRKGRILFWALVGVLLIIKRGLSFKEITKLKQP